MTELIISIVELMSGLMGFYCIRGYGCIEVSTSRRDEREGQTKTAETLRLEDSAQRSGETSKKCLTKKCVKVVKKRKSHDGLEKTFVPTVWGTDTKYNEYKYIYNNNIVMRV